MAESQRVRKNGSDVLERVLRTLAGTQYTDEVLQILVVSVCNELNLACAAYALSQNALLLAA